MILNKTKKKKKKSTFKFGHYWPGKLDIKFTVFAVFPNYSQVM